MSTSNNTGSKIAVLSLLDAYSQVHEQAQADQKKFTFSITKARRTLGLRAGTLMGGVLLAEDVREELRALKVLKGAEEQEPELVGEGEKKKTDSKKKMMIDSWSPKRHFVLTNAFEEKEGPKKSVANTKEEETGLRRRKGNNKENEAAANSNNNSEWTVEDAEDTELQKEERLRNADPLDFFGAMPPRELRNAQQEAQKALSEYVEAANLIVAIRQAMEAS